MRPIHKLGVVVKIEDQHEDVKGKSDAYGAFGEHGHVWNGNEGQNKHLWTVLILWDSLESNWIKNKHVKMKKGFVQRLWPYGLVISFILVQLGSFKLCSCSVFRYGRNGLVNLECII